MNFDGVPAPPAPKKARKKSRDVLTYVPKPEQKASHSAKYFYGGAQTLSIMPWQTQTLTSSTVAGDWVTSDVTHIVTLQPGDEDYPASIGDEPWMVRLRQRRENKQLFGRPCTDAELPKKLRKQKAKMQP